MKKEAPSLRLKRGAINPNYKPFSWVFSPYATGVHHDLFNNSQETLVELISSERRERKITGYFGSYNTFNGIKTSGLIPSL